jgi:hypothetical protein
MQQLTIRDSKSVICGALFTSIGAGAFVAALFYPFGSAQRMGPGFFPVMLSALLVLLGMLNVLRGVRVQVDERFGKVAWRPLLAITAAVVGFALLLPHLGLLVAVAFLLVCASLGQERVRIVETLCIAVVLVLLSTALYVYGLDLPLSDVLPH